LAKNTLPPKFSVSKSLSPTQGSKKRGRKVHKRKENCIYFDTDAIVFETLPGAKFKVKVARKSKIEGEKLEPIQIICNLRTQMKNKVTIVKGDSVLVEVDPTDMYFDDTSTILKGTIVERF
jgi:translation initiation factor IF-1